MSLILPGDSIAFPSSSQVTLGPGISASSSRSIDSLTASPAGQEAFIATRLGSLAQRKGKGKESGQSLWVEGRSKRYIPAQRELVLGTVIARHAEGFRVDIGSNQMAQLDALAFEGATKRNKPNLKASSSDQFTRLPVGTLVYARISLANRDMDPEIECFDAATGKAEGFGELKGGLMISMSLEFARQLLTPKYPLLPNIGAHFPFEIAIGMNGRVWLNASDVSQTIAMKRILEGVERGTIGTGKEEVGRAVREYLA